MFQPLCSSLAIISSNEANWQVSLQDLYDLLCSYQFNTQNLHPCKGGANDDDDQNIFNEEVEINKTDQLTLSMCKELFNSGATVNRDNYYMSTICAAHLRNKGVYCRGTICSSRKFVPKSILFTPAEVRVLPRGTTRAAVNPDHNMIAVGWLDNKAVHFISTADKTVMTSVKRRVGNKKEDAPAPELVLNYNKYMGGVDRHDRLRSTFSLGKRHKFKKYYVKLLLFLMDIAFTNARIHYQLANQKKSDKDDARADVSLEIASQLVRKILTLKQSTNVIQMLPKQIGREKLVLLMTVMQ